MVAVAVITVLALTVFTALVTHTDMVAMAAAESTLLPSASTALVVVERLAALEMSVLAAMAAVVKAVGV